MIREQGDASVTPKRIPFLYYIIIYVGLLGMQLGII